MNFKKKHIISICVVFSLITLSIFVILYKFNVIKEDFTMDGVDVRFVDTDEGDIDVKEFKLGTKNELVSKTETNENEVYDKS